MEQEAGEDTLEFLTPCKWLTTHSLEYAMAFHAAKQGGGHEFDLSILRLLTEGRVEIASNSILGEIKFNSVLPN